MARTVRVLQTASIDLLSGSMVVSGGRIDATQGSVTGTFLGSDVPSISFKGSASFAPNTDSASLAVQSETSSFMGSGSIVSGGLVVATVGPKIITYNNELGKMTSLKNIPDDPEELGGGLNRTKLDLSNYNEGRIIISIQEVKNPGAAGVVQLAPQFSFDETTWDFFSTGTIGGDKPSVFMTESVTAAGGFVALRSESRADVFVRLAAFSGSGDAHIVFGMITVFFR